MRVSGDLVVSSRRQPSIATLGLLLACLCLHAPGCTKKPEQTLSGGGHNASFAPTRPGSCVGPDAVSLFKASSNGSVVSVDLSLTDCDTSLRLNGVNFELLFDPAVVDFLGCSAGSIFPSNKLAPGTPHCTASGGDLLGTVALQLPNSVQVTNGIAPLVRLTFAVRQGGVSSPITFQTTDALQGTSVFFADPINQSVTSYTLGAGNYVSGTFVSN